MERKKTNSILINFVDHSHQAEQNFPPKMVDKATMVDPEILYNSPEKRRLRQRLQYEKSSHAKQMRAVQQKIRRKSEQVNALKSLLQDLREMKLLDSQQAKMMKSLGGVEGQIFDHLLKQSSHEALPKTFSPEH